MCEQDGAPAGDPGASRPPDVDEELLIPDEQRALVLTGRGTLDLLPVAPLHDEDLEEGDVLVRVEYSSVQPLDSKMLAGECGPAPSPETILGCDGVGTVLRSRSARLPRGARVVFVYQNIGEQAGAWRAVLRLGPATAALAAPLPRDVAPQAAAAGATSTLVALACIRHFPAGALLVVTGACGACGLALVQLALLRGMRVVALLRGTERLTWLSREHGSTGDLSVVDCSSPTWCNLAAELCGAGTDGVTGGADGLIDGCGGELLPEAAERLLRPRGTLVLYGSCAGPVDEARLEAAVRARNLRVRRGEGVRRFSECQDAEAQLEAALKLMAAGTYRPHAWQLVNWRDAMHTLIPQPPWSRHISQFTQGRIGRILLKIT